jgi:hypothetical protein
MRSNLLLSLIAIALLGLFGWARQDRARSDETRAGTVVEDEDSTLFVG